MKLNDEQFNKALEIFQEFGPRMRIPVHQRWQEAFPDVAPNDMPEWETIFGEIEEFAYGVAEQVRDNGLDEGIAVHRIAERFPRLSDDRVKHTYNQARYFAMK
jgi:hypothetical protein